MDLNQGAVVFRGPLSIHSATCMKTLDLIEIPRIYCDAFSCHIITGKAFSNIVFRIQDLKLNYRPEKYLHTNSGCQYMSDSVLSPKMSVLVRFTDVLNPIFQILFRTLQKLFLSKQCLFAKQIYQARHIVLGSQLDLYPQTISQRFKQHEYNFLFHSFRFIVLGTLYFSC